MPTCKLLTPIVAAALLCASAAPSPAAEFAVNGGFETGGIYGWALFPSQLGNTTIVSPGSSSNYAACIDNTLPGSSSGIQNGHVGAGVIPSGFPVTITFDARGGGTAGGEAVAEFRSGISGGGVSSLLVLGGGPLALDPDPDVWTTFSFTAVTGPDVSGGVSVRLIAVTGADPGSSMTLCVDNLSIFVEDAVPAGASSWSALKSTF